jgi:predicted lipoprotein with Yx(FWY)xxD motif
MEAHMHSRYPVALGLLIATAALAACNQATEEGVGNGVAEPAAPAAVATAPAVPTAGNPGVPPRAESVTGTTLMLATVGASEPYLADSAGSALYTIEGTTEASACTDACLDVWPPLLAQTGQPTVGPQLQAGMVGTIPREDGAMQVTYNGHPLYRYAADTGTGRTAGQGVEDQWGHWYLVSPSGEVLHGAEPQPEEAPGT